ncbi:hypothetical protein FDECE_10376 [Fusarium decemcellulare]|nr:hypothetical protein FDECE_10376 [Fusarium decemcellulare]
MPRGPGRPNFLGEWENVAETYLDEEYIPGGSFYVDRIARPGSVESDVREAWTTILASVFSIYEGYQVSHEHDIHGQSIDMKVSRVQNRRRHNFLVMELKRNSYPNSKRALRAAEDQLKEYLKALGDTDEKRLWGALCIGRSVQFYKVTITEQGVVRLANLNAEMLRIDRQPQAVVEMLQYIKEQAG